MNKKVIFDRTIKIYSLSLMTHGFATAARFAAAERAALE